ncbi:hypothetical protein P171DRAFT_137034 [Karstenula rhodostoma CBS 690.94]|uniref:Uncharacterized protein n=1 Tax=Karstenula rhodostoma CBS 690.94 TaxID=1392251 RepID=A0A9P4PWM9_9PLEO|nr:hypothetical protein P171DRAFT_137034 [Karstenula rhodostoma CBS 690.94]
MEDGPAAIRPHTCRARTPRPHPHIPPRIGHWCIVCCLGHPRSPPNTGPGTRLRSTARQATRGRGYPVRLGARCREQSQDDARVDATPERLCLLCRSLWPGGSPAASTKLASDASMFAAVSDTSQSSTQATVSSL